jgi:hypothetical protein
MKIVVTPESADPQRPYEHLQPIIDFLAARGNEVTTDKAGFYLTQGGWVCDFRYPIDYALVASAFQLPTSVRFGEKVNAILCDQSWVEIRGNVG